MPYAPIQQIPRAVLCYPQAGVETIAKLWLGRPIDGTFFEVRIFEGEVVQMDPDFNAVGNGAEYYTHQTREAAEKDADEERDRSLAGGWLLYNPTIS